MNYEQLMSHKPTSYGKWVNKEGQTIEFYEHPLHGDSAQVICVSHELKLAAYSNFYEIDDMVSDDREYEPSFVNGELFIGEFKAD